MVFFLIQHQCGSLWKLQSIGENIQKTSKKSQKIRIKSDTPETVSTFVSVVVGSGESRECSIWGCIYSSECMNCTIMFKAGKYLKTVANMDFCLKEIRVTMSQRKSYIILVVDLEYDKQ